MKFETLNDFNYDITLYNNKKITINNGGGAGTSGQVLSSTGSGIQWKTLNDFNYNITLYNDKILNITNGGGAGTSGQVLSSTGNGIQWTTPASGYNNITEDNSGNITTLTIAEQGAENPKVRWASPQRSTRPYVLFSFWVEPTQQVQPTQPVQPAKQTI